MPRPTSGSVIDSMRKKSTSIPTNTMAEKFGSDIFVATTAGGVFYEVEELKLSHRDSCHLFFVQEQGNVSFEVDFQTYKSGACSIMYIHPGQVHRSTGMSNVKGGLLAIDTQHINAEYVRLLDELTPVEPLSLPAEAFGVIKEAMSFCLTLSALGKEPLHRSLLKDSCNVLVALLISQYLTLSGQAETSPAPERITKAFKKLLDENFETNKRPAAYARILHITTPYLNECVKGVTGRAVSDHIQQRVVLEAKRMLYYSDRSVKEIAYDLGYEDYAYFSRLFKKVAGVTALDFRKKSRV